MIQNNLNIKNKNYSNIENIATVFSGCKKAFSPMIECLVSCKFKHSIKLFVTNCLLKISDNLMQIIREGDVKHLISSNFSLPVLYNYIIFSIQCRIDYMRAKFMIKLHRMNYIYSHTASGGWKNIPPVVVFLCKNTLHNRLVYFEK